MISCRPITRPVDDQGKQKLRAPCVWRTPSPGRDAAPLLFEGGFPSLLEFSAFLRPPDQRRAPSPYPSNPVCDDIAISTREGGDNPQRGPITTFDHATRRTTTGYPRPFCAATSFFRYEPAPRPTRSPRGSAPGQPRFHPAPKERP